MRRFMRRLHSEHSGLAAVKYTLIATVAIGAMTTVGQNVLNMLGPAANAMS